MARPIYNMFFMEYCFYLQLYGAQSFSPHTQQCHVPRRMTSPRIGKVQSHLEAKTIIKRSFNREKYS